MQWVAKSAAQVIKDFIEANRPTLPGNPPGTRPWQPDRPGLQAFFAQMQAAMQNFMNEMNAFFNSIAQAIAAIFNPGGALAASLPPEVQDEVAEGTRWPRWPQKRTTADAGSDLSESEAATSLAAEVTESEEVTQTEGVAPETVPVEEPAEAEEVAETPQEPTEESESPIRRSPPRSDRRHPEESTEEAPRKPRRPNRKCPRPSRTTAMPPRARSRIRSRANRYGPDWWPDQGKSATTRKTRKTLKDADDAGDASTADDAARRGFIGQESSGEAA